MDEIYELLNSLQGDFQLLETEKDTISIIIIKQEIADILQRIQELTNDL
jgi:hypothetical protein